MTNALHHGTGRARVRISREDGHARIDVIDDGPGIPADEVRGVFRRFSPSDSHRSPGSGLGLAIARENADLLGAELSVQTIVGIGTRFTMRMPAVDDGVLTTSVASDGRHLETPMLPDSSTGGRTTP